MPALVSRGRSRRTINEINMVPFIDVMLVLLIIFMVTAPLITHGQIDLPSVGSKTQPAKNSSTIQLVLSKEGALQMKTLDASGRASTPTSVNVRDLGESVKRVQAGDANMPVVISADRQVKYEEVVKLMDNLKKAGIQKVGLMVQTNAAGAGS